MIDDYLYVLHTYVVQSNPSWSVVRAHFNIYFPFYVYVLLIKRTLWQSLGIIHFFFSVVQKMSCHLFLLLNKYIFLMYVVLDSHKISEEVEGIQTHKTTVLKSLGVRSRLTAFIQSSEIKNLPRPRFPWLPLYHQFRVFQITISLEHNSIFHYYCFDAKVITDFNTYWPFSLGSFFHHFFQ